MSISKTLSIILILGTVFSSTTLFSQVNAKKLNKTPEEMNQKTDQIKYQKMLSDYVTIPLKSDISWLTDSEKSMLPLLIQAASIIDELYWEQTFGNKSEFLKKIKNQDEIKLSLINYGPWNRLDGNKPFIEGFGEKPLGANYYPVDMKKDEFEKLKNKEKTGLYSLIVRKDDKSLDVVPYHVAYSEKLKKASALIKKASEMSTDAGLKKYLDLRSAALLNDDYFNSDIAWMEMKTNNIDFIIGPIENYDDELFGYKAAYESFVLVKDREWSRLLERYSQLLPQLQKEIPVDEKYKKEIPGSSSDIGVYDALFYAGDCNSGSKTIAINLPNDEKVQLEKGSRKLQLKNVMRAKFDNILVPISLKIIDESQQSHVKFEAFFQNTMFHEVAHGLGIKNTITSNVTVRQALKEQYSWLEEGKADILGLYIVTKLVEMGELKTDILDNYITFVAGIFRSIRFGASSAHAKANLMRYNYFIEQGAIIKNEKGMYKVDFEKMKQAVNSLTEMIIVLQGKGDYEAVKHLFEEKVVIGKSLQEDLDNIKSTNIPIDIIFDQGIKNLGL